MTDLANLLGDVYSAPDTTASPVRTGPHPAGRPEVPGWADDAKLDEVFADWSPGPGPDAPTVERNLMRLVPSAPAPPPRRHLDDDLAAALSAALVEANGPYAASPPPAPLAPPVAPPVARPAPVAPPAAWTSPSTVMAPPSVAVTAPPREWQPGDDDIVPDDGKPSRRRRFGRGR